VDNTNHSPFDQRPILSSPNGVHARKHAAEMADECVALLRRLTQDRGFARDDLPTPEQAAPLRRALRAYVHALRAEHLRPEQALILTKGALAEALPRAGEQYPRLAEAVVSWAIEAYFDREARSVNASPAATT
jgi:hypothetical protein